METPVRIAGDLYVRAETALIRDGAPTYSESRLTGWLERQGFHPILSAFLLFVVSFVLFQGLATVIAIAMILSSTGLPEANAILEVLEKATVPLLVGNTAGQFLGMALPVLLWTRLHTRESTSFLRLKAPDPGLLILAAVGLVVLLPCIQWVGQINELLPLPKFLVDLEKAQLELIDRILGGEVSLGGTVVALAITPAICEELLFRGYLQRQFERSLGAAGGIIVTGILFGLYHFRLSQALPLALLGIYLGFVVWRTGSLWVVVVIHFLNNGFAIAANSIVAANPDLGIDKLESMPVPWPVVAGGAILFALVVKIMNSRVTGLADQSRETEAENG